jgi:hypothetical protein
LRHRQSTAASPVSDLHRFRGIIQIGFFEQVTLDLTGDGRQPCIARIGLLDNCDFRRLFHRSLAASSELIVLCYIPCRHFWPR